MMRTEHYKRITRGVGLVLLAILAAASPLHADEKADALLAEVRGVTAATQTLTADFSFVQQRAGSETRFDGKFRLMRPNLAYVEIGEPLAETLVCDGKTIWRLIRPLNQYTRNAADPTGISVQACLPASLFFHPALIGAPAPAPKGAKPVAVTTKLIGKETIEGTEYQVIEVSQEKPMSITTRLYIGADKRLARMTIDRKGANPVLFTYLLKNVKAEAALNNSDFTFTPPKNARLMGVSASEETDTPPKGKPRK